MSSLLSTMREVGHPLPQRLQAELQFSCKRLSNSAKAGGW